jgi:hypothetical protein
MADAVSTRQMVGEKWHEEAPKSKLLVSCGKTGFFGNCLLLKNQRILAMAVLESKQFSILGAIRGYRRGR